MAWSATGYAMTAGAPVQDAWLLTNSSAGQLPGQSVMITASVTGTVTLTLQSGNTIIVTVQVGDNIYPFACTNRVTGTATVSAVYNLQSTS